MLTEESYVLIMDVALFRRCDMHIIQKTFKVEIFEYDELPPNIQDLFVMAAEVRRNAQAPYSGFKVGVALEGWASGAAYRGCNVERVSHSQCTHAEQNAVDTMVAREGSSKISCVALVAAPKDQDIVLPPPRSEDSIECIEDIPVPCGHCLQIIWENCHEDRHIPLYALARTGEVVKVKIGAALPFAFGPEALGIRYG